MATPENNKVQRLIGQAGFRLFMLEGITCLLHIVCYGALVLTLAVVIDHRLLLADPWRWVAFVVLATPPLIAVLAFLRHTMTHKISRLYVARELEKANPKLHNALVTIVQGGDAASSTPQLQNEVRDAMEKLRRPALYAIGWRGVFVLAALFVAYGATSSQSSSLAASRIVMPWKDLPPPSKTSVDRMTPTNGDLVIAESPWRVTVDASGVPPEDGRLYFRHDAGAWESTPLIRDPETGRFFSDIPPKPGEVRFYAELGDGRSRLSTVTVVRKGNIEMQTVDYAYPEYLQLKSHTANGSVISAVVGTDVTITVLMNQPIQSADLIWQNQTYPFTVEGRRLHLAEPVTVSQSGEYRIQVNVDARQPLFIRRGEVRALPDAPPEISILSPTGNILATPQGSLSFLYSAADDFRVDRVDLVVRQLGTHRISRNTADLNGGFVQADGELELDLAPLKVKPGDWLQCYLSARDANPSGAAALSKVIEISIIAEQNEGDLADGGGLNDEPVPPENTDIDAGEKDQDGKSETAEAPDQGPEQPEDKVEAAEEDKPNERANPKDTAEKNPNCPACDKPMRNNRCTDCQGEFNKPDIPGANDGKKPGGGEKDGDDQAEDDAKKPNDKANDGNAEGDQTDKDGNDGKSEKQDTADNAEEPDHDHDHETKKKEQQEQAAQEKQEAGEKQQQKSDKCAQCENPKKQGQCTNGKCNGGGSGSGGSKPGDGKSGGGEAGDGKAGDKPDNEGEQAAQEAAGDEAGEKQGGQAQSRATDAPGEARQEGGDAGETADDAVQNPEPSDAPPQQQRGGGDGDAQQGATQAGETDGDGKPAATELEPTPAQGSGGKAGDNAEETGDNIVRPDDWKDSPVDARQGDDAAQLDHVDGPEKTEQAAPTEDALWNPDKSKKPDDAEKTGPNFKPTDLTMTDEQGETALESVEPGDTPQPGAPQYSADDLDLIQNFKNALNKLMKQR
jgi:hypothetical protein